MPKKTTQLKSYLYDLPEDRIAKHPLENRDDSKLLLYNHGEIEHKMFRQVQDYLPSDSILFLNNTKVIAARLFFHKPTGGRIEIFLTEPITPHTEFQKALKVTGSCTWKCMIGNLKKWKDGTELSMLIKGQTVSAKLINREEKTVEFKWPTGLEFLEIIESAGHVPLPPYLNREEEYTDKERYQTVFSELEGAVAAPTAGLHFTENILNSLKQKGILSDTLTLHVSAGTFRPIKVQDFQNHDMHNEKIIINRRNIENILNAKGAVLAVGTTALRTLESIHWYGAKLALDPKSEFFIDKNDPYLDKYEKISSQVALTAVLKKFEADSTEELRGETEIFIYPGYDFKVVNGLFTNFHMPASTLVLLVAAFVGNDWQNIYNEALSNNYRFLSYGDTSLLFR